MDWTVAEERRLGVPLSPSSVKQPLIGRSGVEPLDHGAGGRILLGQHRSPIASASARSSARRRVAASLVSALP